MSRIVLCSREWNTSTGRYVRSLVHYLQKVDTKNEYIVLVKPQDVDKPEFTNPNFRKLACPHAEYSFDEQIGLKKQLESLKPDLVHFTMVQQPVLYKGKVVTTMQDLTTMRFKNPSKNPFIFTLKQQVYRWVNKRVAEKSVALITPTQFVKDDIVNFTHVDPAKITVTYEAADRLPDAPEAFAPLKGQQFIMYVGRPTPHKNLPRLIEAFQKLKLTHPDLKLVLAGKKDAVYKLVEEDAKDIPDIVFTDFISDGTLRWLFENCSAYIFPSLSEGFGLPALEAMMHGAPVASSNATCLPEVYGDAAHYFDPLDVDDMAEKIGEILDDPKLRQKLVKAGQRQAAKYSWQRMAEQTLDVYNHALNTKS